MEIVKQNISGTSIAKCLVLLFFGYFCVLMAGITLQYIPVNSDVAFLQIKQTEVSEVAGYLPIFYIHVYTSMLVLLAGFTQFSKAILRSYKRIHRSMGYLYLFVVIVLSGPSGIFMGMHANGGMSSKIAFVLLGSLWVVFTSLAGYFAIKRDIINHKKFMYRSFALAVSAITLRFWKLILVYAFEPAPMDVYRVVAWLG